jgi:PD-(D/E)XK endonuclease
MLTTDQKGTLAEIAIAQAAYELGVGVSKPYGDERYDLIFDLRPELLRVQCKWAFRSADIIIVRCYRARRNAAGLLRRVYSADEIDAFAAYCHDLRACYFLPFSVFGDRATIQLRLVPARNNQRLGINWAAAHEFAATLGAHPGAIAQLGERVAGSDEVAGSIPAGSIAEHRQAGLFS